MEQEKKWGGKRAGSGRKKTENSDDLITLTIKIDKEHKKILDKTYKLFDLFFGKLNRNEYFENLIESEFEYYEEAFFNDHKEGFYKILNEQVYKFIDSRFASLSRFPIPYRDYSDLFNVRIKTNVEKEYIFFIEKEYFKSKKDAFDSCKYDVKQSFNSLYYGDFVPSRKKNDIKEVLRIITIIDNKIDELFNFVYEDNFDYNKWLSDFNDFVSIERRSHIYDLE